MLLSQHPVFDVPSDARFWGLPHPARFHRRPPAPDEDQFVIIQESSAPQP